MFTKEQIENIKEQIIEHIKSNFPEDKKEIAIQSIQSMSSEELESFVKEHGIVKNAEQPKIFRMIVEGKIPSYRIAENKEAIAVLEINPLSKGHTLIIPKKPIRKKEEIKKEHLELAKKVKEKIKEELSPKDVKTIGREMLDEFIINVIPIYKDESTKKTKKIGEKELKEIKEKLKIKEEKTKQEKIQETIKDYQWLPKRIP